MADSRPVVQLMNQLFSQKQLGEYPALRTYIEADGSIFPLVEKGVRGLVRDYGVTPDDAHRFLRRANSMALYVRRQFIEHSLYAKRSDTRPVGAGGGLLSMVQGPNFEQLFMRGDSFDRLCPPQALESLTSPVAYLIELLRWIEQRIEAVSGDSLKLPLHDRRKDLKPLAVDFNAVHQSVSAVDIIVPVLETFINSHEPPADIEQALIEARYPNGLPYYQHWVTLDTVARQHDLSVGDFAHRVDLSFPYFLQPQAWGNDAGRALAHASRLGPFQRKLLTEPAIKEDDRDEFYLQNYGGEGLSWQNLNQVPFFGERTKLGTLGLEALLSVRGFAPVRSANVQTYPEPQPVEPESGRSGSVYLNANAHPAVHITDSGSDPSFLHKLSVAPDESIGLDRYDRMNRKVRLDQWLALPCEQVDALLVAAMNAEVRGGAQRKWWISESVVRALGLFQSLRERYGCTAPDFAVFIDTFSIYGRGEAHSKFDQIFNDQGDYSEPLVLDEGTFPVMPEPGQSDLTVARLCSALNIDLKTYAYLAQVVAGAHSVQNGSFQRSAAIISSFYRLVRLPRLLGITPVEGVLMLTLLGGEPWLNGVAGAPRVNPTPGESPDVLNLLHAMQACTQWCADRNLPVLWMLQQVSSPQAQAATDAERQFLEQVLNLLPGALFTETALLMAGVPPLAGGNWLDLLTVLVDPDGLVIAYPGTELEYLIFAREKLDDAVKDGLGEAFEPERPAIVEIMLSVLLQVRAAQASVAKECLAVYAGVDSEQALHVLTWANATVHRLLRQVLERAPLPPDSQEPARGRNEEPDPLLALLTDVRRRGAVVAKLALGAGLLQDYLDYGYRAWLGQDDKHAFTTRTLYYLTSLTHAFELSEQPAQKLLDYLREVDALDPSLSVDALGLVQQASWVRLAEFFNWSVQEVRECLRHIDPTSQVLKNLTQLDLLMRVRELATHTGMDALTIFLIGILPEGIDKPAYKEAAEHALLNETESGASAFTSSPEDLKQLVKITVAVDNTEVVANKPNEKITFTVTLRDRAGAPLSGVFVRWSATLGTIEAKATGVDGKVAVEFIPGKVMGTDTPLYWLDLFEPQYAPSIHVTADVLSLRVPVPLRSPVPLGEVTYGQEIELYGTLMDDCGNLGKNSLVQWLIETSEPADGQLVFRPRQAFANQEGQARSFVSSPTGGTFEISILAEGSERRSHFEPITFASQE
ncbi:virulence plasmid 28 protein [Pseudomonas sp. SWRI102]|uniref:Virulence plasmid 28 protein n=1 Tax=Pseudomonas marvdashtae TaxID=2745500 RepID=A0A923JQ97_9PSED|nr:Tc toxin subunit A [Pseudomonas marvdashtae]MBV4550569.1 virulence plasmid 28 protein [Pseudomonas marvdashtae]